MGSRIQRVKRSRVTAAKLTRSSRGEAGLSEWLGTGNGSLLVTRQHACRGTAEAQWPELCSGTAQAVRRPRTLPRTRPGGSRRSATCGPQLWGHWACAAPLRRFTTTLGPSGLRRSTTAVPGGSGFSRKPGAGQLRSIGRRRNCQRVWLCAARLRIERGSYFATDLTFRCDPQRSAHSNGDDDAISPFPSRCSPFDVVRLVCFG